jgi:outer membrane protein assembly factor BamB
MTMKWNVFCLALCLGFGGAVGADTVGWRHDGTGTFPDATPPTSWSKDSGYVWKTAMPGKSNASPVLSGDRIFTCSEPDILLCLDRSSGEILWQHDNPAIDLVAEDERATYEMPAAHDVNGRSSATPVTDGSHVYALFGTGVAVCYDVEGNMVWQKLIEAPNHPEAWGHSASPVLADGKLFVHIVNLVALDAATGEEAWRTAAPVKWGSSVATSVGGETVLITPAGYIIRASDGKILQSGLASLTFCAPVVHDGTAYFIQNGGKAIDLPATADGDYAAKWTVAIRDDRYYASPVVHEGLIYTMNRNNHFSVIDAATGEVVYETALPLGAGDAYPSITMAGGHLYASNSNGKTVVFKPGREFEEVATCDLERFQCSPVFAGKRMYVRGWEHMYCIGE